MQIYNNFIKNENFITFAKNLSVMNNEFIPAPQQDSRRPYTFDRVVRIIIAIAGVAVAIWLIRLLSGVLLPFLVAWLIAYLLEPFVLYNKRLLRIKRRTIPVFVTLFELCLLLCAVGVFLIPTVVDEARLVGHMISEYASGSGSIPLIPESVHEFLRNSIDFERISAELTRQDMKAAFDALGGVLSNGIDLVMSVFGWFIVLLYVVFIMLDYDHLIVGFRKLVPQKYQAPVFAIGNDIKDGMNHYFRGQALVALLVGVLFSIGFLIIDMPLAIVLGMFIGLLNLVPYLQLISLLPTTLLCLVYAANSDVNFWYIWWLCMLVYAVVQCIQDLYLVPKIMGKAMGLNPAIILLSLSIWGTLLGFVGLIIALPLTTLLLSYYNKYLKSQNP